MKIYIGIQARMNSSRLPGKVLKNINGIPLIEYLLKRLRYLPNSYEIFILTSNNKTDEPIVNFCKNNKIKFFRGSLTNVYSRYKEFLNKYSGQAVVRISADSPMIDHELIEKMISIFEESEFDILTNVFPRSFPSGQSIEIISTKALIIQQIIFHYQNWSMLLLFFIIIIKSSKFIIYHVHTPIKI